MENNNPQETIDKLKASLTNINAILQECRMKGISINLNVETYIENQESKIEQLIFFHKDKESYIKLEDAFEIKKYE